MSAIRRRKRFIRRLYEDSELDKEKFQFQAQLAEYEKYSTLAQLALGAAHGINNPLLGILSHLELELKSTIDPDQRWEIEQCIAGTKRISATLRGLVNYARPGPLVLSNLSLHRLVTDTLGFLEGQPALRGKRAENQVPEDLPHILVDSNQLSQVLMNLLINAAEATPDGGRITVSAKKLTFVDSIEICVSAIPAAAFLLTFCRTSLNPFSPPSRAKARVLASASAQRMCGETRERFESIAC